MSKAKPYSISKMVVWEAYKRVKANGGAAGVDAESIEEFEKNLKNNLYKIWNRMSSGTYFPPPVRSVEIPKKDGGGERRWAYPRFRTGLPRRSSRCTWSRRWSLTSTPTPTGTGQGGRRGCRWAAGSDAGVTTGSIDLDIRGFFDNLDHALVMRAVGKHTDCPWVLLYVERWLEAPVQLEDGTRVPREGDPARRGSASAAGEYLLASTRSTLDGATHPDVPFERYADDIVAHCRTEEQASRSWKASRATRALPIGSASREDAYRLLQGRRPDGRTSRGEVRLPRVHVPSSPVSKNRWGKYFVNFTPAVSNDAAKKMRQEMRTWRIHLRSDKAIDDLARMWNPVLRGWIQYYGRFYKSALYPVFRHFNGLLVRWAMRKFKRLRKHRRRAEYWLGGIARRDPRLFAHWHLLGLKPAAE